MINDPNSKVKSDWWAVALDETEHWNIPDKYKDKIVQIGTDFFYDRNLITHLCSLQGSYFLHALQQTVVLSEEMHDCENDELREEIYDWIADGWNKANESGDSYQPSFIDEIPDEHQDHYGTVDLGLLDDEITEADIVREHWQGDCPQTRMEP